MTARDPNDPDSLIILKWYYPNLGLPDCLHPINRQSLDQDTSHTGTRLPVPAAQAGAA